MLDCRTLRHGSAEFCMEKVEPLQPSRTSTRDITPPPHTIKMSILVRLGDRETRL